MFYRAILFSCGILFCAATNGAEVSTVAGNGNIQFSGDGGPGLEAGIGNPFGVVIGPDGALYICEVSNHRVRRLNLKTGQILTVAGTGKKGYSGDGGPATQADLNEPYEVRFATNGDMYFVEMMNAIVRKVDAKTKLISTVAGTGEHGFSGDGGDARKAQMKRPHSIALDANNNLYICDIGNHRIRKVNLKTNTIETFSGTGSKLRPPNRTQARGASLSGPRSLDFDGKHSLFLALREGNSLYRIDLKTGILHHLAGTGKKGYSQSSPAETAVLSGPKGVAAAPNGDAYFADTESHTIRVYRAKTKIVETVVGDGVQGDGPDGDALKCRLARPHGICLDSKGNLYIGDSENHRVRVLKTRPDTIE